MSRLLAALVLASLVATPALAQPSAADRDKARELTERAIVLTRKGSYAAAIPLYQRAYELSREAVLLSNIGSAYRELGQRDKALTYFCQYLEKDPAGVVAPFAREQAKRLATDLHPPGDGKQPPGDPCQAAAKPPQDPPKPIPPAPEGDERPEVNEETEETEGDEPTEETQEPAAGSQPVTKRTATPPSSNASGALTTSGIVLGVVGTAALGGAGYYAWVGKRASDIINDNRDGWSDSELEEQRRGEQANSRAKLLGIAGGAAVATGVALIVWGRAIAPSERRLAIVPAVDGHSQGLAILGVFD